MSSEVAKYSACYRKHNYRMGKRDRLWALKDIQSIPKGATYPDVGCGCGETLAMARDHGLVPFGTEIVPELCDGKTVINEEITTQPFDSVDYVSCYDVLEHLPLIEVVPAIAELFRVARRAIFITTNDRRSVLDGMELHLTRKPQKWWEGQFLKHPYSKIEHHTFATESDWHWRITIV